MVPCPGGLFDLSLVRAPEIGELTEDFRRPVPRKPPAL